MGGDGNVDRESGGRGKKIKVEEQKELQMMSEGAARKG